MNAFVLWPHQGSVHAAPYLLNSDDLLLLDRLMSGQYRTMIEMIYSLSGRVWPRWYEVQGYSSVQAAPSCMSLSLGLFYTNNISTSSRNSLHKIHLKPSAGRGRR